MKEIGETAASAPEGIQASYDADATDEFVLPTVVVKNGAPVATIQDNDSIIFYNFRPDRAREITRTFCDDNFAGFDRGPRVKTTFVCFTEYDITIENKQVAFVKEEITNTFGEFLAQQGLKQARIAETEKYAHVTFFFNGGVEEPNKGDVCVGKAVEALREVDGQMFLCADHGNAEQLIDAETGEPFTAHTTNPVPFILINADPAYKLREGGCLADIAPTLIELMGLEQPAEMTGKSLLVK